MADLNLRSQTPQQASLPLSQTNPSMQDSTIEKKHDNIKFDHKIITFTTRNMPTLENHFLAAQFFLANWA